LQKMFTCQDYKMIREMFTCQDYEMITCQGSVQSGEYSFR
jgi:hypothetical protein